MDHLRGDRAILGNDRLPHTARSYAVCTGQREHRQQVSAALGIADERSGHTMRTVAERLRHSLAAEHRNDVKLAIDST
jgi:hypothetical protein